MSVESSRGKKFILRDDDRMRHPSVCYSFSLASSHKGTISSTPEIEVKRMRRGPKTWCIWVAERSKLEGAEVAPRVHFPRDCGCGCRIGVWVAYTTIRKKGVWRALVAYLYDADVGASELEVIFDI